MTSAGVGVGAGMGPGFMLPQYLQQAIPAASSPPREVAYTALERIRQLKDMLDSGALTPDEFAEMKKKLLSQL